MLGLFVLIEGSAAAVTWTPRGSEHFHSVCRPELTRSRRTAQCGPGAGPSVVLRPFIDPDASTELTADVV